ncbi:hypothetical protein DV515_00013713, partial [Chloebia gouldiae]
MDGSLVARLPFLCSLHLTPSLAQLGLRQLLGLWNVAGKPSPLQVPIIQVSWWKDSVSPCLDQHILGSVGLCTTAPGAASQKIPAAQERGPGAVGQNSLCWPDDNWDDEEEEEEVKETEVKQ